MDYFKKIIPATILALGLLAIGLGVRSGFRSISDSSRCVAVRGLAEREVKADKVTWPVVYTLTGNDLNSLYNSISANNEKVLAFLKQGGVADSEISISAPQVQDAQANMYSSRDVNYRFIVTSAIVVTSTDVDKVQKLISGQTELLREGVALSTDNYQFPTTYEYTSLNEIKPEMIAEATRNAREAAKKFADDSESDLGKIKTATQGQFSIENRDEYTPWIKNIRVVTSITFYLED